MSPPRAPVGSLRRLLSLARPEATMLSLATLALFAGSLVTLLAPRAVQSLLDVVTSAGGREALDRAVVALVALFAALGGLAFARAYLFTLAGERVVARLRKELFERVLSQEIAFFDARRTGDLLSALSTDTGFLQNAVTVNVSMGLRFLLQALGSLVALVWTSPRLTLVMLSVVPFVAVGAMVFARTVRRLSRATEDALGGASAVAEEVIGAVRTVRAFAREKGEVARYGARVEEVLASGRKVARAYGAFQGAASFAGYAAIALVLRVGGGLVLDGKMSVGELTAFLLYTLMLAVGLGGVSGLYGDYARALGAASRVFELLDRAPLLPLSGGEPVPAGPLGVELERVSFRYPARPEALVLDGLSLRLEAGRVLALVGPSGSGKSSVAALLARFYDAGEGTIVVDGDGEKRELRALDPSAWRESLALVAQEPVLFGASIEENLRYGKPHATREELEAAARAANAHDFVTALPQGYATLVGERGVQLSGGQRQRIAIARALLKDPRLLVLDEATSALDAESEHLVQEALERLMRGRTVLVIAHRLSTIRDAHRIAVLERGRVAEEGTHDELFTRGGLYRRLVERQFEAGR